MRELLFIALVLACPLVMILMMRGIHGGHGDDADGGHAHGHTGGWDHGHGQGDSRRRVASSFRSSKADETE